mmetsp:Transcript_17158/g.12268  ORF Transcript_17158/g.12268 Transcript_17158/m.12268 type:complete len:110 (+) Transcript_17158:1160-1489(+)
MYFIKEEEGSQMKSLNFSLTESLLQMSSSLFSIQNIEPTLFQENDDDVFYYMFNVFNDLQISVVNSSELYWEQLHNATDPVAGQKLNRAYFYASLGCLVFAVIALTPVV